MGEMKTEIFNRRRRRLLDWSSSHRRIMNFANDQSPPEMEDNRLEMLSRAIRPASKFI